MRTKQLEKESNVLRHIAEASEAIRRKHKMLKLGKDTAERAMNEALKPVITPLEKLVTNTEVQLNEKQRTKKKKKKNVWFPPITPWRKDSDDDESSDASYASANSLNQVQTSTPRHMGALSSTSAFKYSTFKKDVSFNDEVDDNVIKPAQYEKSIESLSGTPTESFKISTAVAPSPIDVENLLMNNVRKFGTVKEKDLDTAYGVRNLKDGMKIGNANVLIDGASISLKNDKIDAKYELTPGLITLIFDKFPNISDVTDADRQNYRKIILNTNAHKKYYEEKADLRNPTTKYAEKYNKIIEPLLGAAKTGKALLPQYMIAPSANRKTDYVWWDDPNELVERLRLLMASQATGNNSHNNEIFSIIEELREARIIY